MTIERLYKTIEEMRNTYNFDDKDATITVDNTGYVETTVKICTADRAKEVYVILEKHVSGRESQNDNN